MISSADASGVEGAARESARAESSREAARRAVEKRAMAEASKKEEEAVEKYVAANADGLLTKKQKAVDRRFSGRLRRFRLRCQGR